MSSKNRKKYWYRFLSLNQLWVKLFFGFCFIVLFLFCSLIFYYHTQAAQYDLSVMDRNLKEHALFTDDREYLGVLSRQPFRVASREQMPDHLIQALIAREDNHFYEHSGIDYRAIARSLIENVSSMRYKQGGSTITMQLARNLFELRDRTMDRKLLEVSIARRLEKEYGKERILTEYLNRIYYGRSIYGIANAARYYFGKQVSQLNLVECATLVGLIRGPALFNPVKSMKEAVGVKNETLRAMFEMNFITKEEYERALDDPIIINKAVGVYPPASYPLMAVEYELDKLGLDIKCSTPEMFVHSYFDAAIQSYTERELESSLRFVEGRGAPSSGWIDIIKLSSGESAQAIEKRLKSLAKIRQLSPYRAGGTSDYLQCAVLVVDGRVNRKGNILAITSGRSTRDGLDRWQHEMTAGRAASPFLFSLACQPGEGQTYVIANRPEQTGRRLGYKRVMDYFEKLQLSDQLPSAEQAEQLYTGMFPVKRWTLARLTYSLLHHGMDFPFRLIQGVYSHTRVPLYMPADVAITEIIRRESAYTVRELPPFRVVEKKPLSLNITLPDNGGQWSMMSSRNEVSVFVWMGFDDPHTPIAAQKRLQSRLAYVAPLLTEQIYQYASKQFRQSNSKQKSKKS